MNHLHIAIVSDQVLANLIPALMDRPDKVILLCSETMQRKGLATRLSRLLKRSGITIEVRGGAPDSDLASILDFAYTVVEEIERAYPQWSITLNATGGTKLMALGLVQVFREFGARVIYTDTAHRRLEVLPGERGRREPPVLMTDVLTVRDYLAAQGFIIQDDPSANAVLIECMAERKEASKYLAQNAHALGDFIGALNHLASNTRSDRGETFSQPRQMFNRQPHADWRKALEILVKCKTLKWNGGLEVEFLGADTAGFLNGGWLEEYAWHIVRDEKVHDCRLNVRGTWEGGNGARNEFDVLACHSNQLLFIECKTLKLDDSPKDDDLAYKVKNLGDDARGLFGETWLLSARAPSSILLDRARQARFKVIGPAELPNLRKLVRGWMSGPGN
jgi:Domain of unknown function (DUF1887)